jgi:hypothetical protein
MPVPGERDRLQIHNYYGIEQASFDHRRLNARIGEATVTETALKGRVQVTAEPVREHPEWMSDAGELEWDLTARKAHHLRPRLRNQPALRWSRAFQMFWHVQGIKTQYEGTITLDGERYLVRPESCAGYQDKNWRGLHQSVDLAELRGFTPSRRRRALADDLPGCRRRHSGGVRPPAEPAVDHRVLPRRPALRLQLLQVLDATGAAVRVHGERG